MFNQTEGNNINRMKANDPIREKYIEKLSRMKKSLQLEFNKVRFQKAIAEAAKIIYEKGSKNFNEGDWKRITEVYYNQVDKIKTIRLKRLMSQEIVKYEINRTLRELYLREGIDEDEIIELYKLAKEYAKEKKNSSDIIKLMEKVENAFNLQPDRVKTTRQIDYSEDKLSLKESKESES